MAWVENFRHLFKESAPAERILIAGGMNLTGDLLFTGPGTVAAHHQGNLFSEHFISIDCTSRILGSCRTGNMHNSGHIDGDITSAGHTRLGNGSHTRGRIVSESLEIDVEADYQGSLEIGSSLR
jgi:cytoskeletal protein CcmA (bactofilin family)